MRRLKGLFVNHVPASNIYGAGTSFSTMLDGLRGGLDVHVIAPAPIDPRRDRRALFEEELRKYELDPDHLRLEFLPWDNCYEGAPTDNAARSTMALRNLLHLCFGRRLRLYIAGADFDFVYLNSLVLSPMTSLHNASIVHVREVLQLRDPGTAARMSRARGAIFIDGRTRGAVREHVRCSVETTLTNPFDMRPLEARSRGFSIGKWKADLGIREDRRRIFSCIGTVSPIKGVHTVIEAFVRAKMDDATLLVVGAMKDPTYERRCRGIAAGNEDVVFMNEVKDMGEVYLATDHVVRGDPDFRLGRTVYEGLFAGCGAVIPGTEEEILNEGSLAQFRGEVGCYEAQNVDSLVAALREACARPVERRSFGSNVDEYCKSIESFIRVVVQS